VRDQSQRWPGLSSCRLLGRVGAAGTEGTFAWKGLEPGMAGRTSPLFHVSCCANATMGVRGRGMQSQGLASHRDRAGNTARKSKRMHVSQSAAVAAVTSRVETRGLLAVTPLYK